LKAKVECNIVLAGENYHDREDLVAQASLPAWFADWKSALRFYNHYLKGKNNET
jgi:hypothetical protein